MNHRASVSAALAALLLVSACGGSPTQPRPPVIQPPIIDPPDPPAPAPTFAVTKIMAFGDSLTEGDPPELGQFRLLPIHDPSTPGGQKSYPFKLSTILTTTYTGQAMQIQVFNLGKGGERAESSETRARLIDALARHQPEVLLLMHGTNDLLNEAPQNAIVNAVEELMELAQARNVQVFLAGLPPNQRPPAAAQVPEYNVRLRNLALGRNVPFVDIFPNIDTQTMMDPDGLHINELGNQKIAEIFYAALKAMYHRDPQ